MRLSQSIHLAIAIGLILVFGAMETSAADVEVVNWLRGTGKDLELRLSGDILETDGLPAKEIEITGRLRGLRGNRDIVAVIQENHFEMWIPVNALDWHALHLSARSPQTGNRTDLILQTSELRQAIGKGVNLTLKAPTQQVDVKVVDEGQPVNGATVKVVYGFLIESQSTTDESGMAHFALPDMEISRLMAWTDDFRIGGHEIDRDLITKNGIDGYQVELSACHDHKIRFVGRDGLPVVGLKLFLEIISKDWNSYVDNEHSMMTTDANGEVIDRWFPDWESPICLVILQTDEWDLRDYDDDLKLIGDVAIVKVVKSKTAERKRVKGQVKSDNSSVSGVCVKLNSFLGKIEENRDELTVFTDADGSFTLDVLPDETYCSYILDSEWQSQFVDVTPYESKTDRINPPQITMFQGQIIEVIVTSGPKKLPYPNLLISFTREPADVGVGCFNAPEYPEWKSTTNEAGRVMTRAVPGQLQVSIHTPHWHSTETVVVSEDEPVTKIYFHCDEEEKRK